jgi:aryl-alcohol dehydrogenase-like predicted oxidoreductase
MLTRPLGDTGIRISEIGLGCWTLGGPSWEQGRPSGWAPVDETEAAAAIDYAVDHGVNHFDNADVYGDGHAERLLARALGSRTTDVIIASKVGHFRGTAAHAYEPAHIRHQCEQSLINLRREYLDIYYFHHGDFGPDDRYLDGACEVMDRLRQEGKIRCVGLSAYSSKDFTRLVPRIRPAVVQSWAHAMDYHFIAPQSPLMKLCEQYRMSFVAFSPLNQGILLGKYSSANPPRFSAGDHRQRSEKFKAAYLAQAGTALDKIKERFGSSVEELARVALQFVLYHDHVAGVIPGFRNIAQVKVNLAAADQPLNGEQIALVRRAFEKLKVES